MPHPWTRAAACGNLQVCECPCHKISHVKHMDRRLSYPVSTYRITDAPSSSGCWHGCFAMLKPTYMRVNPYSRRTSTCRVVCSDASYLSTKTCTIILQKPFSINIWDTCALALPVCLCSVRRLLPNMWQAAAPIQSPSSAIQSSTSDFAQGASGTVSHPRTRHTRVQLTGSPLPSHDATRMSAITLSTTHNFKLLQPPTAHGHHLFAKRRFLVLRSSHSLLGP